MSEWFKELVLKTSDEKSSVGSNPTSSAIYARNWIKASSSLATSNSQFGSF